MKTVIKILVIILLFISCKDNEEKDAIIERNYTVVISSSINNHYFERYACDTVIWITDRHFKLKNFDSKEAWIEINLPEALIMKVIPN